MDLLRKRRNIAILGSTGSIGRSTLEVVAHLNEHFSVSYLSAHRNVDLLREQVERFRPRGVVILEEEMASSLRRLLPSGTEVLTGEEGLLEIAGRGEIDILLNALVGFAGLQPTLRAIENGIDIALANKETLVAAGELVMRRVKERGVKLLPVDSEHSAILQCLQGEQTREVRRLLLTASGGPFLHYDAARLNTVTVREALNHPTWNMGRKISVDSATLMNKGLEVIEACRLFDMPPEKVEVLVHPQSIIHSMVEFTDGSIKAQLSKPDMRMPIQYALMYPERPPAAYRETDFTEIGQLTFLKPDPGRFRCLTLAFRAVRMGGTAPAVLNAANEVAVQLFLEERIPFTAIPELIEQSLDAHTPVPNASFDDIVRFDRMTRETVMAGFHTPGRPLHGNTAGHPATL